MLREIALERTGDDNSVLPSLLQQAFTRSYGQVLLRSGLSHRQRDISLFQAVPHPSSLHRSDHGYGVAATYYAVAKKDGDAVTVAVTVRRSDGSDSIIVRDREFE